MHYCICFVPKAHVFANSCAVRKGLDLFGARRRLTRTSMATSPAATEQQLSGFTPDELELLINGRREIDVDEVRTSSSPCLKFL